MRASTKAIVAAVLAAGAPMVWFRGFTVDDALISARVAHHLAVGLGYRFNPTGVVVDAVTPLGWAPLLALFAEDSVLAGLLAAKWLGALVWLGAAAVLGALLAPLRARAIAVALACVFVSAPLACWAVSGMETGLVTALATVAVALRGTPAAIALGLAAALRPELLPWAVTLAGARAWMAHPELGPARVRACALSVASAAIPFIVVALVRSVTFGHAAPLASIAKPSDVAHGLRYALGAMAFSGPTWLLIAARPYGSASPRTRAIALAAAVHVLAVVLAGGDWMPFYRLFVPVLPSILLAGAEVASLTTHRAAFAARAVLALAASLMVASTLGPAARDVGVQRNELIATARSTLRDARRVATLDVGWVGAATHAEIVDLAGVTDPSIARLPGGHTSKRLPSGLLELRAVDTLILLAHEPRLTDWPELAFSRQVESAIPTLSSFSEFRPVLLVPLRGTKQAYVVARRASFEPAAPGQ